VTSADSSTTRPQAVLTKPRWSGPAGSLRRRLPLMAAASSAARRTSALPVEAGSARRSGLECALTVMRATGAPAVLAAARTGSLCEPEAITNVNVRRPVGSCRQQFVQAEHAEKPERTMPEAMLPAVWSVRRWRRCRGSLSTPSRTWRSRRAGLLGGTTRLCSLIGRCGLSVGSANDGSVALHRVADRGPADERRRARYGAWRWPSR
jgi:hypothetical protein